MSFPIQTLVVNPSGKKKHTIGPLDAQVSLVNKDGTDFSAGSSAYELPAAGEDTLGGIKQYAPEQAIGNVDSNIAEAAADTPTKDEFDKLVTACGGPWKWRHVLPIRRRTSRIRCYMY